MAFDTSTRNRLASFVAAARGLIADEFTEQFQSLYGISATGDIAPLDRLSHLDEEGLGIAARLRERIDYLIKNHPHDKDGARVAVARLAREQAFTVLNRLAAVRMAEKRGIIVESVGQSYQSKGFKVFETVAGSALGDTYHRYRCYLFCLFDELAIDLGILFDRRSPHALLFPREPALLALLNLLNAQDLQVLWAEDETIGWIYQYYNDPAERKKMREESSAPRNSRELAVRNQFFTPRYVVEFLTDNTLGRLWYEMTKGRTSLRERCRYLVRRPNEVFLGNPSVISCLSHAAPWVRAIVVSANFADLPEDPSVSALSDLGLAIDGYGELERRGRTWDEFIETFYNPQAEAAEKSGTPWQGDAFELWCALFAYQRGCLRNGDYREKDLASADSVLRHLWPALRHALQQTPENLTQQELLQQPVFIPHRPLKDPREVRLLDPACGSMHFGLYAFDLFEIIYQEAYAAHVDVGTAALRDSSGGLAWARDFPVEEDFLREIPRLIVERNLHGIDIDPRAAQIAGLSLWLRAQRAWHQAGIAPADRPRITRSNLVCAEPMPGEKELLREFVEQQFPAGERPAFAFLLETVFDRMTLAGEAGSLLRIEEEIRAAIAEAKRLWKAGPKHEQATLFPEDGARPGQGEMRLDLSGITDEQFWERAEQRIYDALEAYAEQAENGGGFQRRLFADDAAQGFAFIDLCRKRYDVVVMNPPFGEFSLPFRDLASTQFAGGSNDIITAFVERGAELKAPSGFIGAISSRTVFFAPTSAKWRKKVVSPEGIAVFVELGGGVLDGAMVEVCMYVLGGNVRGPSLFVRPKNTAGEFVLTNIYAETGAKTYLIPLNAFDALDGMPFAYWLDDRIFWCLDNMPSLEEVGLKVRVGLQTGDDFRFIRLWTEVPTDDLSSQWFSHAKGGDNSPYYTDVHLVVNWKDGGEEIKAQPSVRLNMYSGTNPDLYLAPGMTFSYRTNRFSPAALPQNTITGVAGMGVFTRAPELPSGLAFLNSSAVNEFISARLGLLEINALYQAGTVQPTPVPKFTERQTQQLTELGTKLVTLVRSNLVTAETSRLFSVQRPTLPTQGSLSLEAAIVQDFDAIDRIVGDAYGFDNRAADDINTAGRYEFGASIRALLAGCSISVSDQLAYTVGTAFGRWDIRYATGERPAPELPDPFAPLPVCPPGMLQGDDGLPLGKEKGRRMKEEGKYPLDVAWDGILVDDPEHPLDLERRVHAALAVLWGGGGATSTSADALEHEACALLGVPTLREWFRRPAGFFADHLKRYSKSRRQAPIYWPLSTASGRYTLWLYYHRLTNQTLHTCLIDFLDPKIRQVQAELGSLNGQTGTRAGEVREFLDELKDLHDEIERIIKLPWKPNLNDGVLITASPLHKLFRLPAWRNKLQTCWNELAKGDYDWAHLAHSIWPQRVEKACEKDRSIAIAHGLEHLCKVEPPKPKAKKKSAKKATKNGPAADLDLI